MNSMPRVSAWPRLAASLLALPLLALLSMPAVADSTARFNPITPASTNTPLAGDLNPGVLGDELAYFNGATQTFHLCTQLFAANPLNCIAYSVPAPVGGVPLLGKWTVLDNVARPALYVRSTGELKIYSYTVCEPADCEQSAGGLVLHEVIDLGLTDADPVAGDWDGDGVDSVALVKPLPPSNLWRKGQVYFYTDGHGSFSRSNIWGLDVRGLTAIAGDWPGTAGGGDSLAFYDNVANQALMLDGLSSVTLLTVTELGVQGLHPLGYNSPWDGGGIGVYSPPNCGTNFCHAVDLFWVVSNRTVAQRWPHITPQLDPRFPDDTGGGG